MPLIRLVDQSNLWSGQPDSLPRDAAAGITGVWTPAFPEKGTVVHRPKATRSGTNAKHAESPNDHSIAVWDWIKHRYISFLRCVTLLPFVVDGHNKLIGLVENFGLNSYSMDCIRFLKNLEIEILAVISTAFDNSSSSTKSSLIALTINRYNLAV